MNSSIPASGVTSGYPPVSFAPAGAQGPQAITLPLGTHAAPVPGPHPVTNAQSHAFTGALHSAGNAQSLQSLPVSQPVQATTPELSTLPLRTHNGSINIYVPPHMTSTNGNNQYFSASRQASFLRSIQMFTRGNLPSASIQVNHGNQRCQLLTYNRTNIGMLQLLVDQNNVLQQARLTGYTRNATGQLQRSTGQVRFDSDSAFADTPSLTLDDIQWLEQYLPADALSHFINQGLQAYDRNDPRQQAGNDNALVRFQGQFGNPRAAWSGEVEFRWNNGRFQPVFVTAQSGQQQPHSATHPSRMRAQTAPSSSSSTAGIGNSGGKSLTLLVDGGFMHQDDYRRLLPPQYAHAKVAPVLAMSDALGVVLPFHLVGNPAGGMNLNEVAGQLQKFGIQNLSSTTINAGRRSDAGPNGKGWIEHQLENILKNPQFDGAVVEYHRTDRSMQPPLAESHFLSISRHGDGNNAYWRIADSCTGEMAKFPIGQEHAMAAYLASLYRQGPIDQEKLSILGLWRSEIADLNGLRSSSTSFLGGIPANVVPHPDLNSLFGLTQLGQQFDTQSQQMLAELKQVACFFTHVATQPVPTPEIVPNGARFFRTDPINWHRVMQVHADPLDSRHAQVMSDLLGHPVLPMAIKAYAPDRTQTMMERIAAVAQRDRRSTRIYNVDEGTDASGRLANFIAVMTESRLLIEFTRNKDGKTATIHVQMRCDGQGRWWVNDPKQWTEAPGGPMAVLNKALQNRAPQTPMRILRLGEFHRTHWKNSMRAEILKDSYTRLAKPEYRFDGLAGQQPGESNDAFIDRVARAVISAGYHDKGLKRTLNRLLHFAQINIHMKRPTFLQLYARGHLTPGNESFIDKFVYLYGRNYQSNIPAPKFLQGNKNATQRSLSFLLQVLANGNIKKAYRRGW